MVIELSLTTAFVLLLFLSLATCTGLVVLALHVRSYQRELIKLEKALHESELKINNQQTFSKAFIKRIDAINQQLQGMNDAQESIEKNIQGQGSYKQALKMVEMGASLDEVMETCELGRAEAELLQNIQGYRESV